MRWSLSDIALDLIKLMSQPNILIDNLDPPRACIADFGFSAIAPDASSDPDAPKDVGGTFGYMAPELFQESAKPSQEADIYAFGMVVYEVITGTRPFRQYKMVELPILTTQGLRPTKPEDPVAVGFGSGTWEFIEKCWDQSCGERPTAGAAVEHFERIAATSTDVDPGPVLRPDVVDDETFPMADYNLKNICESTSRHHVPHLTAFLAKLFTPGYFPTKPKPDGILGHICKFRGPAVVSSF